jgi:hypothetical protein
MALADLYTVTFLSSDRCDWRFVSAPDGPRYAQGNKMGEWLIGRRLLFSLATSIFWWWRMKGLRWLAASLLVFQQVILVGAGFVAGMSVSGDWL